MKSNHLLSLTILETTVFSSFSRYELHLIAIAHPSLEVIFQKQFFLLLSVISNDQKYPTVMQIWAAYKALSSWVCSNATCLEHSAFLPQGIFTSPLLFQPVEFSYLYIIDCVFVQSIPFLFYPAYLYRTLSLFHRIL